MIQILNQPKTKKITTIEFLAKLSHYQLKGGPKNFAKNHDKYAWNKK